MRKLYREFFYIPKYGKVREKVMLTRIATTVAIVLVCLVAMGISAYAYFTCNVTSGSSIIKTANFEAKVTVLDAENALIETMRTQNSMQTYQLATGTYTLRLEKGASSAETGFCIIYVGETKYHTQQIGADVTAANNARPYVEFQLDIKQATTVSIQSHWGTSSHYSYNSTSDNEHYITNSEPVRVIVIGTDTLDSLTHTVLLGENLVGIAEKYGTSVSRIVAYNKIADQSYIQAGQVIKIPPADWQMPEDNIEQATPAPETAPPDDTHSATQTTTGEETDLPADEEAASTENLDEQTSEQPLPETQLPEQSDSTTLS